MIIIRKTILTGRFVLSWRQVVMALVGITFMAPASRAQTESTPTDSTAITIAVLDFKNNSGRFAFAALEKSVPEMLKTELSRERSGLLVVERQKLEAVLQEQALGQTGVIDEKTAQAVGQLAGAEYLLTGEISMTGSRLRIDCHLLKVATGQVRGEKVIGPDRQALNEMVRLLASNILFNLTGAGHYRESVHLKNYPAAWLFLATALSVGATGVTHWVSHDNYEKYQSATKLAEMNDNYNRANNYRKARNALAIASGALALASLNFWRKNRSENNQLFAANAPEKLHPENEVTIFAGTGKIQIGLRIHF